jgi:large subunit ribosomal protein L13Ae
MFEKEIIIDGKGHLLGRLASVVAKELLSGQRIIVVRAERINISGSLFRNKIKFSDFMRKKMVHNPRRGIVHYRAPSRVFWRSVRGMLPHKTPRGAAALAKLKIFEGVPAPYDTRKRQVVPSALKVIRLKNFRDFCLLGDLCTHAGWKHQNVVEKLESKRKERSHKFWEKKHGAQTKRAQAVKSNDFKALREKLSALGH